MKHELKQELKDKWSLPWQEAWDKYINEKWPNGKIQKKLGVATKTLKKLVLASGHQMRSRNETREKKINKKELELYLKTHSHEEASKHFGVAKGTIFNRSKELNIKTNTSAELKSLRQDNYNLWTKEMFETAQTLLKEHQDYAIVADLMKVNAVTLENYNQTKWHIPISIWTDIEEKAREDLEQTKNYTDTAKKFNINERALMCKNQRCWKIDLSINSTLFGIPTMYNNVQYRSKKEAQVAEYLTVKNVNFEYEKIVKFGHNWTCDFYLLDYDLWVEYDGLEIARENTGVKAYNKDNPKIRYYQQNAFRHLILGKYTWKEQLDAFFKTINNK